MRHASEVITDVAKRRVWARVEGDRSTIASGYHGRGLLQGLLTLFCLGAILVLWPAIGLAAAGGDAQSGSAAGGEQPSFTADDAAALAMADPSVAAVLNGKGAALETAAWGDAEGEPAGYTCVYRWSAADATTIDADWPLLRSGGGQPVAPYDVATYHLRAGSVSGLRVDVLAAGLRIVQVMPVDGETEFSLQEQTWAPLRWVPWFTKHPWVLAPLFVGLMAVLLARAWRGSRAWNRRTPSMTRHDRQFISRLIILVFLIAGFAWQLYEGWYAATGPSVAGTGSSAGDLASLPLLLIPLALFVSAFVLELSAAPRRGSWALLGLLAAAASVFYLATALADTTTNLNLTYYIFLAVLALIAIPRAFAAGKMGWSRNNAPRYG